MKPSSELAQVVAIDEGIKQIAAASFQMRLESTNAIILTRSRGVAVPGFEAVSLQMGELSRELSAGVTRLRAVSLDLLRAVSAHVAIAREADTMAVAEAMAPGKATHVLARLRARAADADDVSRTRRAFDAALDDIRQLGDTGCVLARSAKLEAVYGGALADALTENAGAFTTLADGIYEAIRDLTRRAKQLGGRR